MTKIELSSFLSLSFLVFIVLFTRLGFLFDITITPYSLVLSFVTFCSLVVFLFTLVPVARLTLKSKLVSLSGFIVISIVVFFLSYPLARTFDLSWDGQGYHQTAIIALYDGWNPLKTDTISLKQTLPSQIFAEGYPSALWEIQANIYAAVGQINAAKVTNIALALIALGFLYSLLRTLTFGKFPAFVTSLLIVLQPVFLIQLLTYMQDGLGYQLILIALSSLILLMLKPKSHWPIVAFLFIELLLVSTKYSHLPVALLLGGFAFLVLVNRYLNKEFLFTKKKWLVIILLVGISGVFAYLPYGRNAIVHQALFYPTNIQELMGSVTYNNVPRNLNEHDKLGLLLYGMFSRSQTAMSGDPTNKENIATLKVPFTFSMQELTDGGRQFNNRVGAGGPLYSGLILLSFALLIVMSFAAQSQKERYAIYAAYIIVGLLLFLALLTPTPNLLRYTNQLQLIPFAVLIPLYAVFKRPLVKVIAGLTLILIAMNVTFFTYGVYQNNILENEKMNRQFAEMRDSGETYHVRAQHFYSNYVLLDEQNVPFTIVNDLDCTVEVKDLVSSSNTTHYCSE
ncbi:MAG TPA: hypothetical protein VLF20_01930 [Patescibacteria group bacterium]|nr:hypothetical protein [Patescibacteria group bacterium]